MLTTIAIPRPAADEHLPYYGKYIAQVPGDDAMPTLSIGNVSLNEGNAGTTSFTFAVTLSAAAGVPVTVCTDLLKPGGYGRARGYLQALVERMDTAGASSIAGRLTLSCPTPWPCSHASRFRAPGPRQNPNVRPG